MGNTQVIQGHFTCLKNYFLIVSSVMCSMIFSDIDCAMLQYACDVTMDVIGKPSEAFFMAAVKDMGVDKNKVNKNKHTNKVSSVTFSKLVHFHLHHLQLLSRVNKNENSKNFNHSCSLPQFDVIPSRWCWR